MIFLTLFTASIYKICYGISPGKDKVQNICPFWSTLQSTPQKITDKISVLF